MLDISSKNTSGIIIHMFGIKSNLILISNPIRAYAYPKFKKPMEKTIKRKPTAPQGWGPGRPGPGPGSQAQTGGAASLRFIVFSMDFLHLGYAYALIELEINIRLEFNFKRMYNYPSWHRVD